jgi:hypothetical protein
MHVHSCEIGKFDTGYIDTDTDFLYTQTRAKKMQPEKHKLFREKYEKIKSAQIFLSI